MQAFTYPTAPHVRRHGPDGYRDYEGFRDWLRDEFVFRCVYCLHRERWYGRNATFHIDHFVPVSEDASQSLRYANLVYACAHCNTAKLGVLGVPDPCRVAFGDCVRVKIDGGIEALNGLGEALVKKLRLNSPANIEWRYRLLQLLDALQAQIPALFIDHMAFPSDLPDLRTKRAPSNSAPKSVDDCWFALRERGILPTTY